MHSIQDSHRLHMPGLRVQVNRLHGHQPEGTTCIAATAAVVASATAAVITAACAAAVAAAVPAAPARRRLPLAVAKGRAQHLDVSCLRAGVAADVDEPAAAAGAQVADDSWRQAGAGGVHNNDVRPGHAALKLKLVQVALCGEVGCRM